MHKGASCLVISPHPLIARQQRADGGYKLAQRKGLDQAAIHVGPARAPIHRDVGGDQQHLRSV